MDLHRYSGLVEQLAAEYALGVLRGGPRRRFERISQQDPAIRQAIETWKMRLAAMTEIGHAVAPPPEIWSAIERRLNLVNARRDAAATARPADADATVTPATAPSRQVEPLRPALPTRRPAPKWYENMSFWRGWSVAATAIAAIALVVSIRELTKVVPVPAPVIVQVPVPQAAPEQRVGYVATLADKQSNAMMLVTWDDKTSEVTVRRLSGSSDPTDKSMQLWGLPKEGHPVSLGVLPAGGTAKFKAAALGGYPLLAVSVEPVGGSPNPDGPTGPVVYTGKVVPAA